jgi:hypothetical protein
MTDMHWALKPECSLHTFCKVVSNDGAGVLVSTSCIDFALANCNAASLSVSYEVAKAPIDLDHSPVVLCISTMAPTREVLVRPCTDWLATHLLEDEWYQEKLQEELSQVPNDEWTHKVDEALVDGAFGEVYSLWYCKVLEVAKLVLVKKKG